MPIRDGADTGGDLPVREHGDTRDPSSEVDPERPWGRSDDADPDTDASGTPVPFSRAFFEHVNEGPLEVAYERRLRQPSNWNPVPFAPLLVGIALGILFAYVNVYAVLAVGFTVGGSWYLSYFIGMLLRWRPGLINYVGGASTGASQLVIGLAFVVPALFFVSSGDDATLLPSEVPTWYELAAIGSVGALFGLLFFQFYRRLWVVERPLQYPGGFESAMELLAIGAARHHGTSEARRSLVAVVIGAAVAALVVLLRDLALVRTGTTAEGAPVRESILDVLFGSAWYRYGFVPDIWVFKPIYNGLFYLEPLFLGTGWFVRMRVAGVILLGSLFSHAIVYLDPSATDAFSTFLAWRGTARTLGAGAMVGAGMAGLVRLRHVLWAGAKALFGGSTNAHADEPGVDPGVPARLMPWLFGGGAVVVVVMLMLAGLSFIAAAMVLLVGTFLIGILGLIGVKVTGETAVQAVSPLTLVALLVFVGVFDVLGLSVAEVVLLALVGSAFFATGLVASTDLFLDVKVGHYLGNPPRRQAIAQAAGMVPGIAVGAFTVVFFARGIADGTIVGLAAPFGRLYEGVVLAATGGDIWWEGFLLAAGIGAFIEFGTRLGTAFGIGMVLQSAIPGTLFLGAAARELYERRLIRRGAKSDLAVSVGLPAGLIVGSALGTLVYFVLTQFVL